MATSVYMNESLKSLFDRFSHNVEKYGVSDAVEKLKSDIGMDEATQIGHKSEDFIRELEKEYEGVSRDDAIFFMQECSIVMANNYNDTIDIEDKQKMLEVLRSGDLPTEMNNKLCVAVANEAINTWNHDLLETALIQADGMTLQDFEIFKNDIKIEFGDAEAEKAELIIKIKDNPEKALEELVGKLEAKEITPLEYVDRLASVEKELPTKYKDDIGINLSVEIQNLDDREFPIFTINGRDGLIEDEHNAIGISDEKENNLELTINKNDAIKTIQKHQIKSDNVMDCIAEVNVPPTDPLFASELAQKLANYISAQHIPAGDTDKEKHILSSILPDDQKASFENRFDDITKEHNDEITNHFNRGDRDFDGNPDIKAVEETDMQYGNNDEQDLEEDIDEI